MESRSSFIKDHLSTNKIAELAKELGYDTVEIRNIRDSGLKNITNKEASVYVVFDKSRVSSADPVTYDDNGEVIPLSKRFNESNPDIRYSVGETISETDGDTLNQKQQKAEKTDGFDKDEYGTVNEIKRAMKLVRNFTRLDSSMRKKIIELIRSARGIDNGTLSALSNFMLCREGLNIRFDESIKEKGSFDVIEEGERLILLNPERIKNKKINCDTIFHELYHELRNSNGLGELDAYIAERVSPEFKRKTADKYTLYFNGKSLSEWLREKGYRHTKEAVEEYFKAYKGISYDVVMEEVAANSLGKILGSAKFLSSYKNAGVLERIFIGLKNICLSMVNSKVVIDEDDGISVTFREAMQYKKIFELSFLAAKYNLEAEKKEILKKFLEKRDEGDIQRAASCINSEKMHDTVNKVFALASENDEETRSVKQQMADSIERLSSKESVATIDISRINEHNVKILASETIKSLPDVVETKGVGAVITDKKRLKNGLRYIETSDEYVAYQALVKVLKNGEIIYTKENHKNRGYSTLTMAAPVTFLNDGIEHRLNMAVVLRSEGKTYYKMHRIITESGENSVVIKNKSNAERSAAAEKTAVVTTTSITSNISISQNPDSVNTEDMRKSLPDTLLMYTDEEKRYIQAKSSSVIATTLNDVITFFESAATDASNKSGTMYIGKISSQTAKKIQKETGIDTFNKSIALNSHDLRHMLKEHGDVKTEKMRGQEAISEKNIECVIKTIAEPDEVVAEKDKKNGVTTLIFKKEIEGRTTAITILSEKKKTLTLKTAWIIKNGQHISPPFDAIAPNITPKSELSLDTVHDISISQNPDFVNTEDMRKSLPDDELAYSYESLIAKEDLQIVELPDELPLDENGNLSKKLVRLYAMQNAKKQNNANNTDRETFVYVPDIGKDVRVNRAGLDHGLARSEDTALATIQIGDLLTNAVAVNELNGRTTDKKQTEMSYALLSLGKNKNGTYLVRIIVDKNTNAVSEISSYGLYAIKAKKDGAFFTLKSDEGEDANAPIPYLDSTTISIAELLDFVKSVDLAKSVLSEDVLRKLSLERGKNEFGGSLRYDLADVGKITIESTDHKRYLALKDRNLSLTAKTDYEKLNTVMEKLDITQDNFDYSAYGDRRKLLRKIGAEFGLYKTYQNQDIDIVFAFSKGNMKESVSKQRRNYYKFAKLLSCFDTVIENAVGIEVHNRNAEGYKVDNTLKQCYVLASAFVDGESIIPVKLEVKEFADKENALHIAIALESIKKDEIVTQEVADNGVAQQYAPSSTVSISDFFAKINPSDESFHKYIPKEFLKSSKDKRYDLADMPDTLTVKKVAKLTGYAESTILRYIGRRYIYAVKICGKYAISKKSVINYFAKDKAFKNTQKSKWHIHIIKRYLEQII